MKKLTKTQKDNLLKLYPDAQAIGRTFIQDLLNRNNRNNHNPNKNIPTLTVEEIIFLKNNLSDEDKKIYNEYIQLQEMIARLINKIMLLQQSFHHGFYRVLYFLQPLSIGLKAYCLNPDLSDEDYKNLCQDQVTIIEQGLKSIWKNYVIEIIRIMHIYDVYINILTDVSLYKFDYTVISPDPIRFSGDINAIQGTMLDLANTIDEYNSKMKRKKNKINIPENVTRTLRELGNEEIIDNKTLTQLKKIIDTFDKEKTKITVAPKFDIFFIRDMMRTIM